MASKMLQDDQPTDSLFFSGKGAPLPKFISEKDIRKHFSEFECDIKRIVIFRDQENKSQGKGFITFSSVELAKQALTALRGRHISSKSIPMFLNYWKKGRSSEKPATVIEEKPKTAKYKGGKRSGSAVGQTHVVTSLEETSTEMKWFWEEYGDYQEYDVQATAELTSAWKCHNRGQCHIIINGKVYIVDYSKMTQTNVSTGFVRRIKYTTTERRRTIRRQEHAKATVSAPKPPSAKVLGINPSIKGHSGKDQSISSQTKTATVNVPAQLSVDAAFFKRVEGVLKPFKSVNHTVINKDRPSSSQKLIRITGEKELVDKAHSKLSSDILRYISTKEDAAVQYPPEWKVQKKSCEIFTVKRSSNEWKKISSLFSETLPNVKIMEIHRVQNKLLWEKYEQCRKRIRSKNGGIDNEKTLFHGSRKAPAEDIVGCEEGFDMRWSAEGIWGRANYFAEKASYSNLYAYTKPNGTKEMLVARVLVGDSFPSPPDSALRMPPQKESSSDGLRIKYDTVNGVTYGTKVYMTYDNEKAYPAYIINYKYKD